MAGSLERMESSLVFLLWYVDDCFRAADLHRPATDSGRKHLFDLAFDRPLVGLRGHRRQQPPCEGAARLTIASAMWRYPDRTQVQKASRSQGDAFAAWRPLSTQSGRLVVQTGRREAVLDSMEPRLADKIDARQPIQASGVVA